MSEQTPQTLETELLSHYEEAKRELDERISHRERGFDVYDRLYRNSINPKKWPFKARVTSGMATSIINRKTDRLLANRMQGKMVSKQHGNSVGARVATEVINCQWNDVDVQTDEPMLVRLRKVDQNARKYGAGFAFTPWRTTSRFDGPLLEPLDNRDCLPQPGAKSIDDCEWFQVRRYLTIAAMERANANLKVGMMPLYNPEVLAKLKEADSQGNNYVSVNKSVIGLDDTKNKRVEVVTEYRRDKRVMFVPKQKAMDTMILSETTNPYDHGEIPILRLCYYPIDDDIYGLPELEAVMSLIKADWAFLSQGVEAAQRELYPIVKANPREVQMDTISFTTGKPWLMERPESLVIEQQGLNNLNRMTEIHGLFASMILDGVGESGQDVSIQQASIGTDKTATEVRDTAMLRTARDNANKVVLRQFLARMVWFWHQMNKQFIDSYKLVKISGKDAIEYLTKAGLDGFELSGEGNKLVADYASENSLQWDEAYEVLRSQGQLEQYASPLFPVQMPANPNGTPGPVLPKLRMEEDGREGSLIVTPLDFEEDYDYVPDVEAMSNTDDAQDVQSKNVFFEKAKEVEPQLNADGTKIKWKELLESLAMSAKLKEPEQYFETITPEELAQQQMEQQMGQEMGQNTELQQQEQGV